MVAGDGPTSVRHRARADAEKEASRLARAHPGTEFFVLEAVAMHRRVDVERISFDSADEDGIPEDMPF